MGWEEIFQGNFLKKIYYGEIYLSKENPDTQEYKEILKKIKELSQTIRQNPKTNKNFIELCEYIAIKESIETEMQFELGFKTAIKLIIEGLM